MSKVTPRTEEEMLFELFPKADKDLIIRTAQNIRRDKELDKKDNEQKYNYNVEYK